MGLMAGPFFILQRNGQVKVRFSSHSLTSAPKKAEKLDQYTCFMKVVISAEGNSNILTCQLVLLQENSLSYRVTHIIDWGKVCEREKKNKTNTPQKPS